MIIDTSGAIGASIVGRGIAQVCAAKRLDVVMVDTGKDQTMVCIRGSTGYVELKGAQLVIEAAPANEAQNVSS